MAAVAHAAAAVGGLKVSRGGVAAATAAAAAAGAKPAITHAAAGDASVLGLVLSGLHAQSSSDRPSGNTQALSSRA